LTDQTSQTNPDLSSLPGCEITLELGDVQKQLTICYHDASRITDPVSPRGTTLAPPNVRIINTPLPSRNEIQPPLDSLAAQHDEDPMVFLRKTLKKNYALSELYTLCTDLHIDYETLPGYTSKEDLPREIVLYFERHHRLRDLVLHIQKNREDILLPTNVLKLTSSSSY